MGARHSDAMPYVHDAERFIPPPKRRLRLEADWEKKEQKGFERRQAEASDDPLDNIGRAQERILLQMDVALGCLDLRVPKRSGVHAAKTRLNLGSLNQRDSPKGDKTEPDG